MPEQPSGPALLALARLIFAALEVALDAGEASVAQLIHAACDLSRHLDRESALELLLRAAPPDRPETLERELKRYARAQEIVQAIVAAASGRSNEESEALIVEIIANALKERNQLDHTGTGR